MNGENPRTGLILAAGFGTRLNGAQTATHIKALVPLNGKPLILHTLENLEKAGCGRVVVVVGWEAEKARQEIGEIYQGPMELFFAHNPRYELQNGVSVLAGREYIETDFILTMADHWFEEKIMKGICGHHPPESGATLCVDYKIDLIFDIDDATKVLEQNGLIHAIGKDLSRFNCIDTGVFVCTGALFDALERVYRDRGDASLSEGVQALADRGKMAVLDIGDALWQDIDTPQMMSHAEALLRNRNSP
ncbi:MAG: NTP transferase domain-containing protein [Deltaproteobacteria bacterium]|nr:NTP transferase domain-containing protein [Deltaproteobacteria bacterium]